MDNLLELYKILQKRLAEAGAIFPLKPPRQDFLPEECAELYRSAEGHYETQVETRNFEEALQHLTTMIQIKEFLAKPKAAKLLDGERFEDQEKLHAEIMTGLAKARLADIQRIPGYNPPPVTFPKDTRSAPCLAKDMMRTLKNCIKASKDMHIAERQLRLAADCWWWLYNYYTPGEVLEPEVLTGKGLNVFVWNGALYAGTLQKLWEKHTKSHDLFPREVTARIPGTTFEILAKLELEIGRALTNMEALSSAIQCFNILDSRNEEKVYPRLYSEEEKLKYWLTCAHKWTSLPPPIFPTECSLRSIPENPESFLHNAMAETYSCFLAYSTIKAQDFVPEYGPKILNFLQLIIHIRSLPQ